jgi:5-methylcytosine-specific restriction endonuclease McrA
LYATCKLCDLPFTRTKHRAGKMDYCSRACAREGAAPRGPAHPNWKGGISERSHRSKAAIRARIREIGRCERCGSTENLHGHHRSAYASDPAGREDPSNIEILCAVCHAIRHPSLRNMITIPRERSGHEVACIVCGKMRYVRPHLLGNAKFCSHQCQLSHLHKSLRTKFAESKGETGTLTDRA